MPTIKCHNPNCQKEFTRNQGVRKRHKHAYCSRECSYAAKASPKYTDKVLQFVIDNYIKLRHEGIAEKIGCTIDGLKKQISLWRKNGIAIPYLRRGVKKKEQIRVIRVKPTKMPKQPKDDKGFHQSMQKAPKPTEKRLPNRKVDMTQYKYVKIDSKTFVLRKIA